MYWNGNPKPKKDTYSAGDLGPRESEGGQQRFPSPPRSPRGTPPHPASRLASGCCDRICTRLLTFLFCLRFPFCLLLCVPAVPFSGLAFCILAFPQRFRSLLHVREMFPKRNGPIHPTPDFPTSFAGYVRSRCTSFRLVRVQGTSLRIRLAACTSASLEVTARLDHRAREVWTNSSASIRSALGFFAFSTTQEFATSKRPETQDSNLTPSGYAPIPFGTFRTRGGAQIKTIAIDRCLLLSLALPANFQVPRDKPVAHEIFPRANGGRLLSPDKV